MVLQRWIVFTGQFSHWVKEGESGVGLEDTPGIALSYFLQLQITAFRFI